MALNKLIGDNKLVSTKHDVVCLAKLANIVTDYAAKYHNTQIGAQLHIVAAHLCSAVIMLDDAE